MTTKILGYVGLVGKGNWVTGTYNKNWYVYYAPTNATYAALKDGVTVEPMQGGDGINWMEICRGIGVTTDNNFTNSYKTKLDGAAPLVSPAFTGSPTAPTPSTDENSAAIATATFVKNQKNYIGKKIGAWGDSITAALLSLDQTFSSNSWPAVFGKLSGANVVNNAISGTTMSNKDSNSFCNLANSIDFSSYYGVMLLYGANDYGSNVVIEGTGTDSFKGAFRYAIGKIYESNPNAKITICTPLYMSNCEVSNSAGFTMWDYINACIDIAREYNLPVIDFAHNMAVNASNLSSWSWDGTHGTEAMYIDMGHYVAAKYPGTQNNGLKSKALYLTYTAASGTQHVSMPFKARAMKITGYVQGTKLWSNGNLAEGIQSVVYNSSDTDCVYMTGGAINLQLSEGNKIYGIIQNMSADGFDIVWTLTGAFGGTVGIDILALG